MLDRRSFLIGFSAAVVLIPAIAVGSFKAFAPTIIEGVEEPSNSVRMTWTGMRVTGISYYGTKPTKRARVYMEGPQKHQMLSFDSEDQELIKEWEAANAVPKKTFTIELDIDRDE